LPRLTQDEVFGNVHFVILAGYDTASTAISFAILLLTLHEHHQRSLQLQLDELLGATRGIKNASSWDLRNDIQPLLNGFVGAVIKETLRLYCPVEWLPKRTMVDTVVTDSSGVSHYVAQGTTCCLDFAAIFRHPAHWGPPSGGKQGEDLTPPLQFDPGRWMHTNEKIYSAAYFPFGGGQRHCPGRKFAEVLMAGILARIFLEYSVQFELDDTKLQEAVASGRTRSWVEEQTRKTAIASLYEGIGFSHGIYPERHPRVKFIRRT
jgi:cytochrome P450